MSDKTGLVWQILRIQSIFLVFSFMKFDKYDRLILEVLSRARAGPDCLRRVRALEEAGVIERYAALMSQSKVGLPGNVFVHIGLQREEESELAAFELAVKNIPEVMECYLMTGEFDYLLRVVVSDMADFERLHRDSLTRLPGVARVNSSVTIRTVQKKTELPLH